jgi:hypothetical protein
MSCDIDDLTKTEGITLFSVPNNITSPPDKLRLNTNTNRQYGNAFLFPSTIYDIGIEHTLLRPQNGVYLYKENTPVSFDDSLLSISWKPRMDIGARRIRSILGASFIGNSLDAWQKPLTSLTYGTSRTPRSWDYRLSVFQNARNLNEDILDHHYREMRFSDIEYYFAEINFQNKTCYLGQQRGANSLIFSQIRLDQSVLNSGTLKFTAFQKTSSTIELAALINNNIELNAITNGSTSVGTFGFLQDLGAYTQDEIALVNFGKRSLNDKFTYCSNQKKKYTIGIRWVRDPYGDPTNYFNNLIRELNRVFNIFNIVFEIAYIETIERSVAFGVNAFDLVGNSADFNYVAAAAQNNNLCCCSIPIAGGCAQYPGSTCVGTGWIMFNSYIRDDVNLLAHELGHNFGATHVENNTIMNPSGRNTVNQFADISINQIVQGINGPCLSKATTIPAIFPYSLNPPVSSDTIIEAVGSITLSRNNNDDLRVNGLLIKSRNNPVNYQYMISTGFTALAAENIRGTNTIVWRHSSGALHFWNMDSAWNYVSSYGWHAPGSKEYFATEIDFNMDFNGDGIIGSAQPTSLSFSKNLPNEIYLNQSDMLNLEVIVEAFATNNQKIPLPKDVTYEWYSLGLPETPVGPVNPNIQPTWSKILTRPSSSPNVFSTQYWKSITSTTYRSYKCIVTYNNITVESNAIKVYQKPRITSINVDAYEYYFRYPEELPPFDLEASLSPSLKFSIYSIALTGGPTSVVIWQGPGSFLNNRIQSGKLMPGQRYYLVSEYRETISKPKAKLPYIIDFAPSYSDSSFVPPLAAIDSGNVPTYNIDSGWSLDITENIQSVIVDEKIFIPISEINNIDKINKIYTYRNDQIFLYQKNYDFSNLTRLEPDTIYFIEKDVSETVQLSYSSEE